MTDMVTLSIDGKELEVPKGTLVIRAAEKLGITIPRFCDHPLLDPVGACRQCMVEVEGQRKPFTACTTTCTPDMVVKTHLTSEVAKKAQEGQLEFLLINHPLDCPMCDKGGECPLQDQTLAHGPPDTRMIDSKRRYEKPIAISAQVALDRERCVLCARCTRFSQQISGDPFIELFERGALEQVAIYEDEPYHSYFSGNVVQICPVGALTASSYRFKSRPFDLRSVAGVCNQCSAGCNFRVDVRRGIIQRQLAKENMAVNEMWSCDKGRFGYEFVAHESRLREPMVRSHLGQMQPTFWRGALRRVADSLSAAIEAGGPKSVGVLTGGRLTDEDAYAVGRFARDVLGTDNVDYRLAPRTDEERDVLSAVAGTLGPTYDDVEQADVVVVAGLDPEEEVPILYLRLRKAWRKRRQRIVVVGPSLGSLEDLAWRWIPTAVGAEAQVLSALASADDDTSATGELEALAGELRGADSAVVLAGERLARSPGALAAAVRLSTDLGGETTTFGWVPRRNNARGAVDAGLLPGLLPGGRTLEDAGAVGQVWNRLPDAPGMDTRGMLEAAARGDITALYLIGVDPASDFEDPALAREALERVDTLIVQDLLPSASTRHADVLLPAAAPQERVGSFTTWEGRRQPFPQVVPPQGLALQDWDILRQVARLMGTDLGWESAGDVRREAAPLMEPAGSADERLAEIAAGALGRLAAADAEGKGSGDGALDAVVLDYLLGDGDMLVGADALNATARAPAVWINADDAARLGIAGGDRVAVTGAGVTGGSADDRAEGDRSAHGDGSAHGDARRMELPAYVTARVTPGCVVLPANATPVRPGALSGTASPRVRLEVPVAADAEGEG